MNNYKYSRANLSQFIHTTLRLNKSNFKYFDLLNWDKVLVDINTMGWATYCYLIKSTVSNINLRNNRLLNDCLLLKARLQDTNQISNFVSNVDLTLQKLDIKKRNLIEELNSMDSKFSSMIDVDFDRTY